MNSSRRDAWLGKADAMIRDITRNGHAPPRFIYTRPCNMWIAKLVAARHGLRIICDVNQTEQDFTLRRSLVKVPETAPPSKADKSKQWHAPRPCW